MPPNSNKWGWASTATGKPPAPNRASHTRLLAESAPRGLSGIANETLAHLMHDLGYIVHYSDDEKLRDDVILKPEWLTKAIGFVLEDRKTQELDGILPDNRLYQVWHEHPFKDEPQRYTPDLYPFFLRLMEKYDVSYRLPEGDASLVAQHVPQVRPSLPWQPEEEPKDNQRRLGMVCVMDEAPQGLVPWMIVRTHDYAYPVGQHSLHWQKGMFLRNNSHGEALLELCGREFHMYAEAVWPEYFMNLLRQRLDKLIIDNWPGLEGRYSFIVPCKNNACEGRFEIAALRDFLNDGDETIRCQKCRERQNIIELLYGFEDYDIRENMTTLQRTVDRGFANVGEEFEKLRSQIANNVLVTMKAMANEAKNGPRLFTIEPVDENDNGSTRNTNYNFGAKPKIANILCMTAWAFTNSR
jgi:internalin A